jgi:2-polyprenyl-3-methyl-5-hydroxy-6-metoxy-1,4-benzoquinol methylase
MTPSASPDPRCTLCGGGETRPLFDKAGYRLVQCASCELVFVANPPTAEELARIYSFASGYHSKLQSRRLERLHLREARAHQAIVAAHATPGRVLDVGCSVGAYLRVAREAGWDAVGLEFSRDSSEVARSQHGLEVVTGTLDDRPFPEGSFDLVTLWDVIEHVPDPLRTMGQVHELLRPDGLVAITTPNIDGLFPQASLPIARLIRYWPHPEPPHHLYQFSKRTLTRLLEEAGFELVALVDQRIRLSYSFGGVLGHAKRPYRLPYTALFAPLALAGPWVDRGDTMLAIARRIERKVR